MRSNLQPGVVLADRFVLEVPVGAGGMAIVYRARDLQTGAQVAVKVLRSDISAEYSASHFLREAEILASLAHPHVVSYVAHGQAVQGPAYLAMEWLEGQDLSRSLSLAPLRLCDSLQLITCVAAALSFTHARGIIHRDIKPGNLLLPHGQIGLVKLIDFGVARLLSQRAEHFTQTGMVVGTPEYMAPEQVRGERQIRPAADVFALGCVLYECLAGRPPFLGEHLVAVLGKILFDEPPDLRIYRPGVPAELMALLADMLIKEESQRISDGTALLARLAALPKYEEYDLPLLSAAQAASPSLSPIRAAALTGDVQELLSVVLAAEPGTALSDTLIGQLEDVTSVHKAQRELVAVLKGLGAHAEALVDGNLVAVFRKSSSAVDQATQAAHAALIIRDRWPAAQVVVTMGKGRRPSELPVGEVLDRAAQLLHARTAQTTVPSRTAAERADIVIDERTAGLLTQRFLVTPLARKSEPQESTFVLRGVRAGLDENRPLLGKPTPCVGRERELAQLNAALQSTTEESQAQAVIVIGAAGSGKSRLRHEFLRRAESQDRAFLTLIGRGTLWSKGAEFALLGQALRGLCELQDGDSQAERWQKFQTRISAHLPRERAGEVVSLLALISQVSDPAEPVRAGHLAGAAPSQLQEQLEQALCDFLNAECCQHPVLILLEDLHWGDAQSVRLFDTALRELAQCPLLLVALARPEVEELFPSVFSQRRRLYLPLLGLGRRACEQLIREVLGKAVGTEEIARITAQSAGNALFLEELIRAAAEGNGDEPPDTVLAMLQARLSRLEAHSRTILCAASVFGSQFSVRGVRALLRGRIIDALSDAVAELCEAELIAKQSAAESEEEAVYGFRHDLLRDAAYELLTDEDRTLGHYLAARFLEDSGEREAVKLAEHYRRGNAKQEAAKWFRRAAEQALDASELGATRQRAQSALDAGAVGIERGQLYALQAIAAYWLRNDPETRRRAEQALEFLPPGTADFYLASAHLMVAAGKMKEWDAVSAQLAQVLASHPEPNAVGAYALCLARTGYMFMLQGRPVQMKEIAERLALLDGMLSSCEPQALAQIHHFRSGYAMSSGAVVLGIHHLEQTIAAFERAGDHRNAQRERITLASNYIELGQFARGEQLALQSVHEAETIKVPAQRTSAQVILGYALSHLPERSTEARDILQEAVTRCAAIGNRLHQGWALSALARLSFREGRFAEVEQLTQEAHAMLMVEAPTFQAWPLSWLARALVRQGRASAALAAVEQATASMKTFGKFTLSSLITPLARIEALLALNQKESAVQAIATTKRRVLRSADAMAEPVWRDPFLLHPDVRELLSLPDAV